MLTKNQNRRWNGWLTKLGAVARLILVLTIVRTDALFAQAVVVVLPKPELITARQGLPQAFVPAIVQDARGFIWMATRDGLARFDGYSFRVFQPTADGRPSLSSPGLTNLTMAPDGYIWIQNDQFGLDGFDPVHETFLNLSRQSAYRKTFGQDTLLSVYPDSYRRLWLTFQRGGLACYELDSRRFVKYPHRPNQASTPSSNRVTSVVEDGQRQLWIATMQGLDRYDRMTNQFVHIGNPALPGKGLITDPIRRLYKRPNGELWLCSNWRLHAGIRRQVNLHSYKLERQNQQAAWPNQLTADRQGAEYLNLDSNCFAIAKPRAYSQ